MGRRPRVLCACKCGKYVTTARESDHLQKKYYAKSKRVPSIIRKRPSATHLNTGVASASGQQYQNPLSRSKSSEPVPRPSTPPSRSHNASQLWDRVLGTRARDSNEESTSERSEDLFGDDFQSQCDSDDEVQPQDDPGVPLNPITHGIPPGELLRQDMLVKGVLNAPASLSQSQIDDIETFDFIVKHKVSVATYSTMQDRFVLKRSHSSLSSLRHLRTRVLALSGLKPVLYDCCKDSCVCFAGPFANLNACPDCGLPRKTSTGAPQNTFEFLPPIPQFRALFCDPETSKAMQYRHTYSEDPSKLGDIFGGKRYQELRRTNVEIDGVRQPFKFFEDHREIALGLSADGMCPFKKRKKSCWPLILVNYNLPPEERTHVDNLICVGVIPGPKSPTNMSSFLWPLIEQLLELAKGVTAVDILTKELFLMRAHLLAIFGDIPAISKLLEFLGHNACFPCRFCLINSIRAPTSGGGSHLYCPLHRTAAPFFDPFNLPLRTHNDTLQKGFEILEAPTDAARTRLATGSGVKGISALARVPSVSIPTSFPIDIMHMIFLNLFPQLVDLWTGKFHELDQGSEQYLIDKELWKALGETIDASGATMPSSFGCRVPNLSLPSHGNANAEAWNMFGLYIAPYLLRRRFRKPKYYRHFVRLVNLLKQATSYDLSRAEIPALREGIIKWIQDFERYYYQYKPDRTEVCTVNIHYLLHLVDAIEELGPPGGYWSFLMERFCSLVGSVVKSRRFPFENIARNIRDRQQLKILRHLYGMHESLRFLHDCRKYDENYEGADILPDYPRARLLDKCATPLTVTTQLRNKISAYLGTTFELEGHDINAMIPETLKEWRRLGISQGGDTIQAAGCQKLRADTRDSTFVRYELLVDRYAHYGRVEPDFNRISHYGQLQHIFALPLRPNTPANPSATRKKLLLALIAEAPVKVEKTHEYTVVYYEDALKSGEVVDAQAIQCLVGRFWDSDRFWVVDRSSECELTFPEFV